MSLSHLPADLVIANKFGQPLIRSYVKRGDTVTFTYENEQRTVLARLGFHAGEPIAGLRGEGARRGVVVLSQHADTQGRQVLELGPGGRAVLNAERHERRIE